MSNSYKVGDKVVYATGGRYSRDVSGEIVGQSEDGKWLKTKDTEGKERKIRPGAIRKAA